MAGNDRRGTETHGAETPGAQRAALVDRYRHLTAVRMPQIARTARRDWPVTEDHCFQRIVLDAICGGVWHDDIPRPAYRNMSLDQARAAVALSERIISGQSDLHALNRRSISWRRSGKHSSAN